MRRRYRTKDIFLSPLFEANEVRVITKMIDENIKRSTSVLADARRLDLGTLSDVATFCLRRGNKRVHISEHRDCFRVELISIKKAS